jgi:hypothetical protein
MAAIILNLEEPLNQRWAKCRKNFYNLYILWQKHLNVIHKAERVSNLTLNKKNVLKSVNEETLKKQANLQNSIQDL